MDILLRLKNGADAFLYDSLDRRIIFSSLRIALIFVDSAVALSFGARVLRPVRPVQQWFLALLGCAAALATPIDAANRLPRGIMTWTVLGIVLILVFCPRIIAGGLAPSLAARARIERVLYCFSALTLVLQVVAIWF